MINSREGHNQQMSPRFHKSINQSDHDINGTSVKWNVCEKHASGQRAQ